MTEEMLRLLAAQRREKKDLLLCIDRAWGACAREARRARRKLRCLEGVLALTTEEIRLQPGASAPPAEGPHPGETPLEALQRRLAAAHPWDIEAYCDGKDAFVRALEAEALAAAGPLRDGDAVWYTGDT